VANQKPIRIEMQHQIKIKNLGTKTEKTYLQQCDKFSRYLTNNGFKKATIQEAEAQVQNYMNDLAKNNYAAASQKTALAAICKALNLKMDGFDYARPEISTRGRDNIGLRNERNERVIQFAERVGIRRAEYAKLCGKDYVERDGRSYVIVRKGKGGKYQEQLIAKEDKEFVKKYFDGSNNKVFTEREVKACHDANIHRLRREHAQKMYDHYKAMPADQRVKVVELLEERMNANPRKYGRLDRAMLSRPYVVRGIYRKEYMEKGKSVSLDRFAVLAVSILHLSHYREAVVVHHYLI
jgi:integrase